MILSLRLRLLATSFACVLAAPSLAAAQGQRPAKPGQASSAKPAATPAKPAPAKPATAATPAAKPAAAAAKPAAPAANPATTSAKPAAPAAKPAAAGAKPAAAATPAPAAATAKPAAQGASRGASPVGDATLVEKLGDWAVYLAQTGRTKVCYALSQPDQRLPAGVTRSDAYLFVSVRPAENVRNEVALILGFPANEKGTAEAAVGTSTFALLPKGEAAWLKNPAEEGQLVATMSRGRSLSVKVQSARGSVLTDRYSLTGFGQAVERARRECS